MIKDELEKELTSIRIINDDRDYWFVRTFGGEIFEEFIVNNHVGLGFNDVPEKYITPCSDDENYEAKKELREYIGNHSSLEKGTLTKWTNQVILFHHSIKTGDLVVIPSKDSRYISIGEIITDNVSIYEHGSSFVFKSEYHNYPNRVRKVKWLKHHPKRFFQGDLRNLLSSQQGITNANKYANKIESGISSMFIRENQMRLVINIKQDEDINAYALSRFLDSLIYFHKELCDELGIENNEDLFIKIKLQSRGKTVLKSFAYLGIVGLLGLLSLSEDAGFKLKINEKTGEYELNSTSGKGFLNTFSNFLDKKQERKIKYLEFIDAREKLKIESPTDSIKSLEKSQFIPKKKLEK
ncbi:MAG: hypothetical protein ABJL44_08070 [Algibacter sp.]